MTVYLNNIKGSIDEMDELFDKAEKFSVRHYEMKPENDNWEIVIRCNEEIAPFIKRRKTLKSLLKLDKTFGQSK
jgi:hypothetical protein